MSERVNLHRQLFAELQQPFRSKMTLSGKSPPPEVVVGKIETFLKLAIEDAKHFGHDIEIALKDNRKNVEDLGQEDAEAYYHELFDAYRTVHAAMAAFIGVTQGE